MFTSLWALSPWWDYRRAFMTRQWMCLMQLNLAKPSPGLQTISSGLRRQKIYHTMDWCFICLLQKDKKIKLTATGLEPRTLRAETSITEHSTLKSNNFANSLYEVQILLHFVLGRIINSLKSKHVWWASYRFCMWSLSLMEIVACLEITL